MKKDILKLFLTFAMIFMLTFTGCSNLSSSQEEGIPEFQGNVVEEKTKEDNGKIIDAEENIWSQVEIVTENYPPLNYEEDGIIKGISTKLVRQAIENLGVDIPIKIYPWARAYKMALEQEDVLIYSITRTKEREKLFKWISPVAYEKVYLYALAEKEIKINSLEDIKTNNYKISTMNEDFTEQGLKSMGYEDYIYSVPNQELSVAQIFEGRADLWVATAEGDALKRICDDAGYDVNKLEAVFEIDELRADLYIAASLKTSDEIVETFIEAMPKI